ncbi:MAG: SRPBCC family protein [Stygiobacter sp.]
MTQEKITISTTISADKQKVWNYYTQPEHITQWNFANPSWHCPTATNDLTVGGKYVARMEAKDGSFGFDFDAVYTEINQGDSFTYEFGGRFATVEFKELNGQTEVIITFDPESENSIDLQRNGWQAILDNFKKYTETH